MSERLQFHQMRVAIGSVLITFVLAQNETVPCNNTSIPPPPAACSGTLYTVVEGDTLTSIAAEFGTAVANILTINQQITNPDLIFPSQLICIPPALQCKGPIYTVVSGDTLTSIAAQFNTSLAALEGTQQPDR